MAAPQQQFLFASAPDSWGVLDYPGPSWEQSYEKMLDEMVEAGYTGTELGPYGYFPTDPEILRAQLEKRKLKLLGSFVPVQMGDLNAEKEVIERIRKVGDLLAKLKAPFLVLADDQTPGRNAFSGRANDPACPKLNAEQWKHVGKIVAGAERVAQEFGLDLVFHPHVATYVETSEETEKFFDATSHTGIGLCLDSGHAFYARSPTLSRKRRSSKASCVSFTSRIATRIVLTEARKNKWTFEEAIEHKVFTIIGQGNIDFPAFFRILKKNNYSGWMVVEQDVKFNAYTIPPAQSVAESLAYLAGRRGCSSKFRRSRPIEPD